MDDSKITILVVDDEGNVRRLLQLILEDAGYTVIVASGGQEALEKMARSEEQKPDLILLDVMMPGLNGFEVLRMIRERYVTPVIMLTAVREVESLGEAFNVGANDYVTKPFATGELLARVKAKLRRSNVK